MIATLVHLVPDSHLVQRLSFLLCHLKPMWPFFSDLQHQPRGLRELLLSGLFFFCLSPTNVYSI